MLWLLMEIANHYRLLQNPSIYDDWLQRKGVISNRQRWYLSKFQNSEADS